MSIVEFAVDPMQGKLTSVLNFPRNVRSLFQARRRRALQVPHLLRHHRRPRSRLASRSGVRRNCSSLPSKPPRLPPPARSNSPASLMPSSNPLLCSLFAFISTAKTRSSTPLYELLLNNCARIVLRNPDDPQNRLIELPPDSIRAVGFADDEAVLPFPRRSFTGYRIMQEFFAFPKKFFFIDVNNLAPLASDLFTNKAEIIFLIKPFERSDRQQSLELSVSEKTFRLGCVPIINLFPQTAEPILVRANPLRTPRHSRFPPPPRHRNFFHRRSRFLQRLIAAKSPSSNLSIPATTAAPPETKPSGTPAAAPPTAKMIPAPRCISLSSIAPATPRNPSPKRLWSAALAPIATCPRAFAPA